MPPGNLNGSGDSHGKRQAHYRHEMILINALGRIPSSPKLGVLQPIIIDARNRNEFPFPQATITTTRKPIKHQYTSMLSSRPDRKQLAADKLSQIACGLQSQQNTTVDNLKPTDRLKPSDPQPSAIIQTCSRNDPQSSLKPSALSRHGSRQPSLG